MKNSNILENSFLKIGYIIKKAEKKTALDYVNNFLKQSILRNLKIKKQAKNFSLNNFHEYVSTKELNSVRLELFTRMNKDKKFRNSIFLIAKETLHQLVGNELAMQNKINLSIQVPNDDSSLLPLHSDTWDGDSPFETVLWIPLVNCFKTKSMFILKSSKYEEFNKIYKSNKIKSVSNLHNVLKKDLKFLKINYGNFLLFNQTLPHGNVVNKTKETRISLNCRFKGLFTPYSQKKLGGFFSPISIRPASKIGIKYKFPGE